MPFAEPRPGPTVALVLLRRPGGNHADAVHAGVHVGDMPAVGRGLDAMFETGRGRVEVVTADGMAKIEMLNLPTCGYVGYEWRDE